MSPSRQYPNHPDPMDLWLETQGYYRKLTARDGSCLFRAIAEQIHFTQKFHIDVRKRCVEYMRNHVELFEGQKVEGGIDQYLDHMLSPSQNGGPLEMVALSHLYMVDIIVFREVGVPAEKVAEPQYARKIMLCSSHEKHYDSVYFKDFTKIAGFCQSLVYEVLYKNVFGMKDVDIAVEKMLHYKPLRHRTESGSSGSRKVLTYSYNSIQLQRKDPVGEDGELNVRDLLMKGITPFPYKVAKSLDPNIFRNVELDVWIDFRRGLRQGYLEPINELRVGVKCLVKIYDKTHIGHIQEMAPEKGPVVVFVEELGEKRTVPYESLELLVQEQLPVQQSLVTYPGQRNSPLVNVKSNSSESSGSNKGRRGKRDSESKGKNHFNRTVQVVINSPGGKRNDCRSEQTVSGSANDNLRGTCGVYQDPGIVPNYSNFSIEGSYSSNGNISPYQLKPTLDLGMPLPIQSHLLMPTQQHGSSQILFPVSPRPEDVPAHWLTPSDAPNTLEESQSLAGVQEGNAGAPRAITGDENANYTSDLHSLPGQINFNAPKSVLDDGSDLPLSDIQTLRFFYNLGNDVYRAQCSVQYNWGSFSQPCTVTSPSTPSPTGMCAGKCVCGPVCITTVPTIHRLLEPTTPPANSRRKQKESPNGTAAVTKDSETPPTPPGSNSPSSVSTPLASVPPRFRNKGRNKKDAKAYEGQPLVHQPTLQIPSFEESGTSESHDSGSVSFSTDHSSNLSIPYSPPYSYVYYPSSPVLPYSPVESDPYFTPLRLQFPPDYLPDTPQSPQCFPVNGDLGVYGSSAQYSMLSTSPHYLVPASPGIYVGSPPPWSPVTPSTPQQQS